MINLAFTESVELKEHIRHIDALRVQILTTPLMPKNELKLRWEAKATRIHSSLALAHHLLSRGQIVKILSSQTKHVPQEHQNVLRYKRALEYIESSWTANFKPLTYQAISTMAALALDYPPETLERSLRMVEAPIKSLLDYLENQKDHPVIQAGIALCLLSTTSAIPGDSGLIARLASTTVLTKYGYDCRGLVTIEKQWAGSPSSYEIAIESHAKQGNLNHFLLYFTQTLTENLGERVEDVVQAKVSQGLPASFWELNDRQRTILSYMSEPEVRMTNAMVQKQFGVSQITASRDLSKLTTLGFIISYGKGRAVAYSRA